MYSSVIVPINHNEIIQLIFDCSVDVPNDFYVTIMNLMKNYYEYGNNLEEIHIYLNENKKRINDDLFKKIKNLLKPVNKSINCTISCPTCSCACPSCSNEDLHQSYRCITSLAFTCFFILVIIGMIVAVVLVQVKKNK